MTVSDASIDLFLALRPHLTRVHQVPGRIRLRIAPAAKAVVQQHGAAGTDIGSLERLFGPGSSVRLNRAAGSVVITYPAEAFPAAFWEDCLNGSETRVRDWLADRLAALKTGDCAS
ncbi:hypothetical protein [Roseospirillum parvum]|nr:hypothetical protein [Roseospirillum parvum]